MNHSMDLGLNAELCEVQQLLTSARQRLQAVVLQLHAVTLAQEQTAERLGNGVDIERTRAICAALHQDIQLLQRQLNDQPPADSGSANAVTPELLKWAREQPINEEEIAAGLREIEHTGGLELRDFIHELEEVAGQNE